MRKRRTSQRRERNRALAAGLVLLFVCASGLYFASHSLRTSDDRSERLASSLTAGSGSPHSLGASGNGTGDDDLTTGSILFVPNEGNICRQRLIDNRTWTIRDGGYVTCNEAVSWHTGTTSRKVYTPTSRVEAIRQGFFSK
jgi:hypothetical protein